MRTCGAASELYCIHQGQQSATRGWEGTNNRTVTIIHTNKCTARAKDNSNRSMRPWWRTRHLRVMGYACYSLQLHVCCISHPRSENRRRRRVASNTLKNRRHPHIPPVSSASRFLFIRLSALHTLESVTKAPQEASLRTLVGPSQTPLKLLPVESRTITLVDGGTCVNPPSEKTA